MAATMILGVVSLAIVAWLWSLAGCTSAASTAQPAAHAVGEPQRRIHATNHARVAVVIMAVAMNAALALAAAAASVVNVVPQHIRQTIKSRHKQLHV